MERLATVDDVLGWLEDAPTEGLRRIIGTGLDYASDMARAEGDPGWKDADSVPATVRRIVAAAVARWADNPTGLGTSRAADETVVWQDTPDPSLIKFSDYELGRLRRWRKVPAPRWGAVDVGNGFRVSGLALDFARVDSRFAAGGRKRDRGWR